MEPHSPLQHFHAFHLRQLSVCSGGLISQGSGCTGSHPEAPYAVFELRACLN